MRSRLCDDSWLDMLASFENLETLDVAGNLTDEGLGHLAPLHQLASIKFRSALPITHVGIARLAPLTKLRTLDLSDTPINGSCFDSLRDMENLDSVKLLVPNHGIATIDFHHASRQSNR